MHSRSVPATVCHPWNPLPATRYLSASSAAERAADDAPPPRPLRASALCCAPPPQLRPAGSTIGWLDTVWFNILLNFLPLVVLLALPHSSALRLLSFGLSAAAQVGLILLIRCAPSPSPACASALCGAPPPQLSPDSSTLCAFDPAYQVRSLLTNGLTRNSLTDVILPWSWPVRSSVHQLTAHGSTTIEQSCLLHAPATTLPDTKQNAEGHREQPKLQRMHGRAACFSPLRSPHLEQQASQAGCICFLLNCFFVWP